MRTTYFVFSSVFYGLYVASVHAPVYSQAFTVTVLLHKFYFHCLFSTQTGRKRRGGPGGLNKLCGVSPELQTIVGQAKMPRTEVWISGYFSFLMGPIFLAIFVLLHLTSPFYSDC